MKTMTIDEVQADLAAAISEVNRGRSITIIEKGECMARLLPGTGPITSDTAAATAPVADSDPESKELVKTIDEWVRYLGYSEEVVTRLKTKVLDKRQTARRWSWFFRVFASVTVVWAVLGLRSSLPLQEDASKIIMAVLGAFAEAFAVFKPAVKMKGADWKTASANPRNPEGYEVAGGDLAELNRLINGGFEGYEKVFKLTAALATLAFLFWK